MKIKDEYCQDNSEYCAAVQALIEGDASLTEQFWLFENATDQDRKDIQQFAATYQSPVYDSAPEYLKKDFLFPYREGQEFVQTLYDQDGFRSVDGAYQNPPVSTEQILHPEKYPDDTPAEVNIPDLKALLGEGWREVDNNMVGEWYTYLILTSGADEQVRLPEAQGREAAAGWAGDKLLFYLKGGTGNTALILRSQWESQADAAQFWNALSDYGNKRWGSPAQQEQASLKWQDTPDGYVAFYLGQTETLWVTAPDQATADAIHQKMIDIGSFSTAP
jgi:hypothetical protein